MATNCIGTFRSFRVVVPNRVDLAGGTLDIYPLYLLIGDAMTVNAAVAVRSEVAARIRWHRFLAALGDLRRVAGRLKRGVFGAGSATVDGPRFRSIDAAAAHVGKVTSA